MGAPLHPLTSILISRTDSIGDVVLTLPVAGLLRARFPDARIGFLCTPYTRPVAEACRYVDEAVPLAGFLAQPASEGSPWQCIIHVFPVAAIARQAAALRIPYRIGTSSRAYHWLTCNELVRLSRRHSPLHEAQLNIALLKPLGIDQLPTPDELSQLTGLTKIPRLSEAWSHLLQPGKFHLILHPKSSGSAREWGTERFLRLIQLLDPERYQIFISGTSKEREALAPLVQLAGDRVTDLSGKMDLETFMAFIAACDGLVAASTGPLHLAAAMGKKTIGIYPPIRPMHPGRWAPLGAEAVALTARPECSDCRKMPAACHCMGEVSAEAVSRLIGVVHVPTPTDCAINTQPDNSPNR